MKKNLLILVITITATSSFSQRISPVTVQSRTTTFFSVGLNSLSANSLIYCVDSQKVYSLAVSAVGSGSLSTVPHNNVSSSDNYWTKIGNNIYNNNTGNVGIGLTNPQYKFSVSGTANFASTIRANSTLDFTSYGNYISWEGNKTLTSYPNLNLQFGENSLTNITSSANYNIAIGDGSLTLMTSSIFNTAVGSQALQDALGNSNTAIGFGTGSVLSTGNSNTFIGALSNTNNSNISNSTAIGTLATVDASNKMQLGSTTVNIWQLGNKHLFNSTSLGIGTTNPTYALTVNGSGQMAGMNYTGLASGAITTALGIDANNNVFKGTITSGWGLNGNNVVGAYIGTIGNSSFRGIQNGLPAFLIDSGNTGNISFGVNALSKIYSGGQAGLNNIAIGRYAGFQTTNGTNSISIGTSAGYGQNLVNGNSVFIGHYAGATANTSGATIIGHNAGYNNTSGINATIIGYQAGATGDGISSEGRVFIGAYAGQGASVAGLPSGQADNTYIGYKSGMAVTNSTIRNVFVGYKTGMVNYGDQNCFVGVFAGTANQDGNSNTAIGGYSFFSHISGDHNTIIGSVAGYSNTSGAWNTLIGRSSGGNGTSFTDVTAVGGRAGVNNTSDGNVFIGKDAGYGVTSGLQNCLVGSYTIASSTSIGSYNAVLGNYAGFATTTGSGNTLVGYKAGQSITTGQANTCIGSGADVSVGTLVNVTAIGVGTIVSSSNSFNFGNLAVTDFGFGTQGTFKVNASQITDNVITPRTVISGSGIIDIDSAGFTILHITFNYNTDGSVWNLKYDQLHSGINTVLSTDTNGNYCIFDNGTGIAIKNRLAFTVTSKINLTY